jgi:hypothetical protein
LAVYEIAMNEIGLICLLPEEIRDYHKELRRKIAAQFGLSNVANPIIPAHVTMKYGFPVENLDELENAIQEFSLAQCKTSWLVEGFGHFQNDEDYVIFINVTASDDTRKVHAHFLDKLREISWVKWGGFDNANMHYHVTLAAQGITSANFEAVWTFIHQQGKPSFEAYFDNLSLVKHNEGSRSLYKVYWFQG